MKNFKILTSFLSVFALALFMGCDKDAESGTISLNFDHKVGTEALELENKAYQSLAGHPFYIYRLKYFRLWTKSRQKKIGKTIAMYNV